LSIDWNYLCVEMMLEYVPEEIETWSNADKFTEICDHFISVSTILAVRIKKERNISNLMIDDDKNIAKIAFLMKRSVRQAFEFAKQQLIEE